MTALEDRRPIAKANVVLQGDSSRFAVTDTSGRFQFSRVPRGSYRIRVRHLGYDALFDTISVPLRHGWLEVELAHDFDVLSCVNERILAERPALTLGSADSTSSVHALQDGSRLRHTVVALPLERGVQFTSRIANVGTSPAAITSLCYPAAAATVLKRLISVGPTCYGGGATIAPGDSMVVVTGGPLRGRPGRYQFRVHPVDPPLLDAKLDLDLIEVKDDR